MIYKRVFLFVIVYFIFFWLIVVVRGYYVFLL